MNTVVHSSTKGSYDTRLDMVYAPATLRRKLACVTGFISLNRFLPSGSGVPHGRYQVDWISGAWLVTMLQVRRDVLLTFVKSVP
jgi:hypothetical protein